MKILAAIVLNTIICLQSYAQSCEQPTGLISAYYNYSINYGSGIGIEAGIVDDDFPLGLMLGCNYIVNKKKNIDELPDLVQNNFANFYLKVIVRVLRKENRISAFVVASPQLSFYSEFNFQSGFKIFLPLSERLALQAEPLYSLKQKTCLFNFHLSFVL